jgi:phage terminase large subunit-like protein
MRHNAKRSREVIEFIQMLHLVDDFYGQQFILPAWQSEIITDVYGTVTENNLRQYNFAYLEIPKKNGKTTLIAGLSLYHLTCDPPDGQIYCCAADRKQAELVYKAAIGMINQDEDLQAIFKIIDSRKEIINTITKTTLKVLSSEAYTKHGLNPTVVIFDELHAQPNRYLWDTMTFGAGSARKEPLWWVITTAGDDPDRHSIGWEIHDLAIKLADGEKTDPTWYVKVYNAPDDCDIFDEENWYKANPSLGITINIEAVRKEAMAARNSEGAEKLFRWLRLNQWVSLKRIGWLPLTLWDITEGKNDLADLVGKKCYAGLDLSSTTDLTALTILFPPQEGLDNWYAIFEAWIPDEGIKQRVAKDHVAYDKWVNQKFIHATPGNAVDYDFIKATITQLSLKYDLIMLGTDPWNSRMLTQELMKNDVRVTEIAQTMAGMSPSMKHIEKLLLKKELLHEKNPVARWCFGNISVAIDGNENIKPMKNKSIERIDVIVSMINAMAVAMENEMESVYEERGLTVL